MTQALVMDPPYTPFVNNSGKHYEKQENISHIPVLISYSDLMADPALSRRLKTF